MKTILAFILVVGLSGCGVADRWLAGVKGESRICVDGVLYIQFTSGVSVAYSPDGTIRTCK